MHDQDVMLRKEKAGYKTDRMIRKHNPVRYEIEEDDIIILSGPYTGRKVRELWPLGPVERDYIVKKLWSTGDEKIVKIINSMTCE